MSISPTLRCPCKGQFLTAAFQYTEPPEGETRFDWGEQLYRRGYDRCTLCGHWFGHHDLDLSRLYAGDYVEKTYGGVEGMRRRFAKIMALPYEQSDNRQRVARVRAFAHSRGIDERQQPRLLDVGAGLGVFPAVMAENGWQVMALEQDVRTVEYLQSVVAIDALAQDLLNIKPAVVGLFDVVTFNKVLEHVEDPAALLIAARRLLTPNGFVYVEVPDVAAAVDGPDREEFFVEHHHVFNLISLAMLIDRTNYTIFQLGNLLEPSGKFTVYTFSICEGLY
ncbi:MAG: class I SAM-dependent methyltransferase [Candidatus Competibacteraceae bacterium]|nr:class I SAM-dependent methyltransferase [Candidatus Competibacteraceae bacterium]